MLTSLLRRRGAVRRDHGRRLRVPAQAGQRRRPGRCRSAPSLQVARCWTRPRPPPCWSGCAAAGCPTIPRYATLSPPGAAHPRPHRRRPHQPPDRGGDAPGGEDGEELRLLPAAQARRHAAHRSRGVRHRAATSGSLIGEGRSTRVSVSWAPGGATAARRSWEQQDRRRPERTMQSSTDPRPVVVAVDASELRARRGGLGRRHRGGLVGATAPRPRRPRRSTGPSVGPASPLARRAARRRRAGGGTSLFRGGPARRHDHNARRPRRRRPDDGVGQLRHGCVRGHAGREHVECRRRTSGLPGCRGPRIGARIAPPRSGPVVVGVDGSAAGAAALEFGADLAASLGSRLLAVRCWSDVYAAPDASAHRSHRSREVLAAEAAASLDGQLRTIATRHPDLQVERKLVDAPPLQALTECAGSARVLVVGTRGRTQPDRHPDGLHQPGARRVRDLPGRRCSPAARPLRRSSRHVGHGGTVVNPIAVGATAVVSFLAALVVLVLVTLDRGCRTPASSAAQRAAAGAEDEPSMPTRIGPTEPPSAAVAFI